MLKLNGRINISDMRVKIEARKIFLVLMSAVVAIGFDPSAVLAETSNSASFQATEMQFGSGGTLESCSGEYCAQASIGAMSPDGQSVSPSTSAFGAIASDEPLLEVIVDSGESNLGNLSTEKTATKTMVVRVRNYLSNGYIMQVVGDSPSFQQHQLKNPAAPSVSKPGSEQFAINLVANSAPNVGDNPAQIPSDELIFGSVEPNYDQANMFMYRPGDVVARSHSTFGRTDYTISMIVNIANSTPVGHYAGDYGVVVTPVY